jgi:mannose-1-phosphate guanylyltransferase / phosphomannomutase
MTRQAADLNIDLGPGWFIGDTTTDIQTAKNAGLRSILLQTGVGGGNGKIPVQPDFTTADLPAAVRPILTRS